MGHFSDPPDDIVEAKKNKSKYRRKKQPSIIFYGRNLTVAAVTRTINIRLKKQVRILGQDSLLLEELFFGHMKPNY